MNIFVVPILALSLLSSISFAEVFSGDSSLINLSPHAVLKFTKPFLALSENATLSSYSTLCATNMTQGQYFQFQPGDQAEIFRIEEEPYMCGVGGCMGPYLQIIFTNWSRIENGHKIFLTEDPLGPLQCVGRLIFNNTAKDFTIDDLKAVFDGAIEIAE